MKKCMAVLVAVLICLPIYASAQKKKVNEYGEAYPDTVTIESVQKTPAKASAPASKSIKEKDIGATSQKTVPQEDIVPISAETETSFSGITTSGREHKFRVGFIGPGVAVFNQDVGTRLLVGAEADYFFFERLSAGLKTQVATKFKSTTVMDVVPFVRYTFDSDRFPRWSVHAEAGVGLGLYFYNGGTHANADIMIPGGGFFWQWTKHISVGADTALHIFTREGTGVGWTLSPAFRYIF